MCCLCVGSFSYAAQGQFVSKIQFFFWVWGGSWGMDEKICNFLFFQIMSGKTLIWGLGGEVGSIFLFWGQLKAVSGFLSLLGFRGCWWCVWGCRRLSSVRKGQKTQRPKDEYGRTRFWTLGQFSRDEKSQHPRHPTSQQMHAHVRLCPQSQETPQIHATQNKNPRQSPRNTPAGRQFAYKHLKNTRFYPEKPHVASSNTFLEIQLFLIKSSKLRKQLK